MEPQSQIEELYRRHAAALVLFAMAIAGDRGRAQDAVQQVFLKLMQGDALRRAVDTRAYLFTCVRNAVLNDVKERSRQVELTPDSVWFIPPDRDHSAERNVRRSLQNLPEDQRQTVVLHIWGELTFAEIAEVLNISPNTAASRYRYALEKLRELVGAPEDCHADS